MRNKLNAKQKATREPDEKKNERHAMEKKDLYEKYETEINRKRMKCEAELKRFFLFFIWLNRCEMERERDR